MLNTTRATDIAKVVTALDPVAQDTLMKYLYKGMASVEDGGNCSVLLNWHEKVCCMRYCLPSYGARYSFNETLADIRMRPVLCTLSHSSRRSPA